MEQLVNLVPPDQQDSRVLSVRLVSLVLPVMLDQ